MWLDWQLTTLITGVRQLFMGLQVKDPAYTAPEQLEKAGEQAAHSMEILDASLANTGSYVAGDTLTIADCALAMFVHRWYALPIERQEFIALEAYYERLKEREPFRKWIIDQGV
jgi:glutathione S-transferase